jgi:tagaturonate reductase
VQGALVDEHVDVGSIGDGLDANERWDEVERRFLEARCVVSNTGDRGYEFDPADRPDGEIPRSFPSKLAKLLLSRYRAGAGPLTFFPCELKSANGDALRNAVLEALDKWDTPPGPRHWVCTQCVWVNSLVDRIVSQSLEPVGAVAEPYALWAIEDRPGLKLPCRHADIVVTDDLKQYERLKLYILNLGHSFLAESWALAGGAPTLTVREAMANEALRGQLDDLYAKEVLPAFAQIGIEEEAFAYRDSVIDRFSNPFLDHRLSDIFVSHAAKKKQRFGGLIKLVETNGLRLDQPRLRAALSSNDAGVSADAK